MTMSKKTASKRLLVRRGKTKGQGLLSVISVRVSDKEKKRLEEIMRLFDIKNYSDVLRMAIKMVQVPINDEPERTGTFH